MTFPLTKDEMNDISELRVKLSKQAFLSPVEQQTYMDVLALMQSRGVIQRINTWGRTLYTVIGDMDAFEQWIKKENQKAKQLSRREWRIAVVSAIIGATIGLIPMIVNWL